MQSSLMPYLSTIEHCILLAKLYNNDERKTKARETNEMRLKLMYRVNMCNELMLTNMQHSNNTYLSRSFLNLANAFVTVISRLLAKIVLRKCCACAY